MYRIVCLLLFLIVFCSCVWTQDKVVQNEPKTLEELNLINKTIAAEDKKILENKDTKELAEDGFEAQKEAQEQEKKLEDEFIDNKLEFNAKIEFDKDDLREELKKSYIKENPFFEPPTNTPIRYEPAKKFQKGEKFHWKPAIVESLYFLGIQNVIRTGQKKTRQEFKGEFFRDWAVSARNLSGWRDGDSLFTNYVAHPMQGAVTGRIFINNSDRSKKLEFGRSKEYWKSRFKAMAWSAVWSTQFELGPISEASIGNVGLYDRTGPNRMGWVDMVITPTAGTGVLIGEDIIDKFIIKKWLEKGLSPNQTRVKVYRTFFAPFQSFTNILRGKVPWHRDNR